MNAVTKFTAVTTVHYSHAVHKFQHGEYYEMLQTKITLLSTRGTLEK